VAVGGSGSVAVGVAVVQCECGSDSGSGWQWVAVGVWQWEWQWVAVVQWECGGGTLAVGQVAVWHRWHSGAGGTRGSGTVGGSVSQVTMVQWDTWQGWHSGSSDIGSLACGSDTMACCQSHIVQQQQIEPLPVASWQRQKSQVWSQCTHCHFFLPTHIRDRLFPEVDPHNPIHRPATATATATSGSGSGSGTEAGLLHYIVQNGAHTDSRRNGTAVPAEFVKKNGN
jgi:hypothetical protein